MAEACYMACAATKQHVLNKINKLTLQTNKHKQYMHDAILLFQKGVHRVLVSQFNPSNLGKGMVKLLDDGNNILTHVKLTDAITAGFVIKSKKTSGQTLINDWQNHHPYLHLKNGGTGRSQPVERHQSMGHQCKGGHC